MYDGVLTLIVTSSELDEELQLKVTTRGTHHNFRRPEMTTDIPAAFDNIYPAQYYFQRALPCQIVGIATPSVEQ